MNKTTARGKRRAGAPDDAWGAYVISIHGEVIACHAERHGLLHACYCHVDVWVGPHLERNGRAGGERKRGRRSGLVRVFCVEYWSK